MRPFSVRERERGNKRDRGRENQRESVLREKERDIKASAAAKISYRKKKNTNNAIRYSQHPYSDTLRVHGVQPGLPLVICPPFLSATWSSLPAFA